MSNITGSINLAGFKHILEKRKNSKGEMIDCITIPLSANYLNKTDKGNVYVNISAWPRKNAPKNENDKSTHIVNQDPGKDVRAKLKEANEYPPTLGNLTVWDQASGETNDQPANYGTFEGTADDLPF